MAVKVTVLPPQEDWPEVREEFYSSRPGKKVARPHSDAVRKSTRHKEGHPDKCDIASELGGSFVNDPYFKQKGK